MPLELHQLKKLDDHRFLVPRCTKPRMSTDAVLDAVHNAGLARRVARLKPMGVSKGEGVGNRSVGLRESALHLACQIILNADIIDQRELLFQEIDVFFFIGQDYLENLG